MLTQWTWRGEGRQGGGMAAREDEGTSYLPLFCRESRQPWGMHPIILASCNTSPGNKAFQVPGTQNRRPAKPDAYYLFHGLQQRCPPQPGETLWGQHPLRGKGCHPWLHEGLSWGGWGPCFSGARRLPWVHSLVLTPTPPVA